MGDTLNVPRDSFGAACDNLADLWLPKMVLDRLEDASRIIVFTTGPVGPKGYGSSYPRELADALKRDPEPMLGADGEPAPWWLAANEEEGRRHRPAISARRITMAEEASRWPGLYLVGQDGPLRVLNVYLRCKVYRRPFDAACKRRQWSRATAYRARDRAAAMIAQGLNRDRVEIR